MGTLKRRTCFGIFLALLFLLCIPVHAVHAKETSVEDCYKGKGDCTETDSKSPSKKTDSDIHKQSDTKDEGQTVSDADTFSPAASLVKMVLALALILILIYGVLKFLSSRSRSFQHNRTMQNVGGISVGQNKSIQLVRIGSKLYMVGVGENVELLEEITDEQVKRDMFDNGGNNAGGRPNGIKASLFSSVMNSQNENSSIKDKFTKELDKLKANRRRLIRKREEEEERHE